LSTDKRERAVKRALDLLDAMAGEGLEHDGICADDACSDLADAFGVELEPGWTNKVAALCVAAPSPSILGSEVNKDRTGRHGSEVA